MVKALSLAAVAAIAIGLLWSVDAVTNVESYDETRRIDPWAERATFVYAPIRADDSSELAMGEPGYFTNDAPRVRIGFEWKLDDPSMERVTAIGSVRLVVQHEANAGKPAWTHEEWIVNGTLAGASGDALVLTGEIDIPAIEDAIEQTPGRRTDDAAWSIVARVKFFTAPNAAHAGEASDFTLPIAYTPPLYVLPGEAGTTILKDHAHTEVLHHESRDGPRALLARPAGIALLFGGLAVLARTLPALTRDEEAMA